MRIRTVIAGVVLGSTAAVGVAACGPAQTFVPIRTTGNVYDCCHRVVMRLVDDETVGVGPTGFVFRNDGNGHSEPVGWANLWSGATVYADPSGGSAGPVGAPSRTLVGNGWWLSNQYYEQRFNMGVTVNLYGYGVRIGRGTCDLVTYFRSGPSSARPTSWTVGCTVLHTSTARVADAGHPAYDRLTPAQKARVADFRRWAATVNFGGK